MSSKSVLFWLSLLALSSCRTLAWTTPSSAFRKEYSTSTSHSSFAVLNASPNDEDTDATFPEQPSEAQREQEMMLEQLSSIGADKISKMDVSERAKRAMLAEAVEDQIFELTEILEGFIDKNGMIPEEHREQAVELAKQIKGLQLQYSDLVSGEPCTILQTLDALGSSSSEE